MPEYMQENLEYQARRRGDPSGRDLGGEDLAVGALRPVGLVLSVRPGRVSRHRRALADRDWVARPPTSRRRAPRRCSGRSQRGSRSGRVAWQFARDYAGRANGARCGRRAASDADDRRRRRDPRSGRTAPSSSRSARPARSTPATGSSRAARSRRARRRRRRSRASCTRSSASTSRTPHRGSPASTPIPHGTVRLHFFRVRRWSGEPHGREGQAFSWQRVDAPTVAPMLPANAPVFRALALADRVRDHRTRARSARRRFSPRFAAGLPPVCAWSSCGRKRCRPIALVRLAHEVVRLVRAAGGIVLVNGDAALARESGAHGVHLTAAQLAAARTRPGVRIRRRVDSRRRRAPQGRGARARFRGAGPARGDPHPSAGGDARLGGVRGASRGTRRSRCSRSAGSHAAISSAPGAHGAHGLAMIRGAWDE